MGKNNPSPPPSSRRILVALDASSPRLTALEAAADLAGALHAELCGLVVEDTKLLRLAGLPIAREIASSSATMRALDLAVMERILRSRSEEVRWALAEAANRVRVRWSFQVAQGRMAETSLAAARDADMLIIGQQRPGLHPLIPREKFHADHPIVVAFEGSSDSERVLQIAAELTPAREDRIAIVMVADEVERVRELRQRATQWVSTHGRPSATCSRSANDAETLANVARRLEARLVMVGSDSRLLESPHVERLLELLECPLAMAR